MEKNIETEIIEESNSTAEVSSEVSYERIIISILSLVVIFAISFGVFYFFKITYEKKELDKIRQRDNAYYESLLLNKPTNLQNIFVEDINKGVNNMNTKSAAYFITHRFFDNNGNIYEIYDYVESHPELSFMKEAEAIYPDIFEKVKKKELPAVYTYASFYAYLAYVEVLHKYGYADIAALATAANQYAGNMYFRVTIAKELTEKEKVEYLKNKERDIKKALWFFDLANGDAEKILEGKLTTSDVPARDILVGLNQYGSALRYLAALGVNATSTKTSGEVFAFAVDYASHFVPELNIFTALINASTLAILDSSTKEEVKTALLPILNFDTKKQNQQNEKVISRIVEAKFEQKPEDVTRTRMDVYSKRNILLLTSRVPEFKSWLMSNGWAESDFK